MEREDLIVRASSPNIQVQEETSQVFVVRESLIPRSSSLEELAQYTKQEVAIEVRPVFTKPQLVQLEKAMEESFCVSFHGSREMVRAVHAKQIVHKIEQYLKTHYPCLKAISENDYIKVEGGLLKHACGEPFLSQSQIKKVLNPETADMCMDFYSEECLLSLYDLFKRGGNLSKETQKSLCPAFGSIIFIQRMCPQYLYFHFSNLSAEIFDYSFELYKAYSFQHKIKNALLLTYICFEMYEKLIQDFIHDTGVKVFSGQFILDFIDPLTTLFKRRSNIADLFKRKKGPALDPVADQKVFLSNFSREFADFKEQVRQNSNHALNFDYIEFYLSKHASVREALDNPDVFPQAILSEFAMVHSLNAQKIHSNALANENQKCADSIDSLYEVYYSRSHFFLLFDQYHFSAEIAFLERKLKSVKVAQLKDAFSLEIYQSIQDLLLKLKTMDLASPAYQIDDISAIHKDLGILYLLIENLQSISSLAKAGLIPALKTPVKTMPQRKGKKKKPQKSPALVTVAEPLALIPVPVVITKKATPSKNQELKKISEISQRITQNIEKENQYYKAAKDYILSLMTNTHAKDLVEDLFNLKSNLKNILSQKDMTLIVEQMSTRIEAISENLRGSNGFRFRVEDEIFTCHASTAEIGHKGHGGAIKAFRDFLIAVYTKHH